MDQVIYVDYNQNLEFYPELNFDLINLGFKLSPEEGSTFFKKPERLTSSSTKLENISYWIPHGLAGVSLNSKLPKI